MFLSEHHAKFILSSFGISTPKGHIITKIEDISLASAKLGNEMVLKAQVPVGGRGKAGGIKFVTSVKEAKECLRTMLGSQLKGYPVTEVLIEETLDIQAEFYVGVITDTDNSCPLVIVSTRGGMDIEEAARENPQAVVKIAIDPFFGITDYQTRFLVNQAGFNKTLKDKIAKWLQQIYRVYWETDAQLVEINPLVLTTDGNLVAGDAKMVIDDNALFRHSLISELRVLSESELKAKTANINYVPLDGEIGIIGTGAGMAMAIMDQVAFFGGKPANFMDVGPGINNGGGRVGLDILLRRPELKGILISGYSGGRLELFARDIVSTLAEHLNAKLPIVVRLQGINDDEAQEILQQCPYENLHFSKGFDEAALKIVELSRKE